MGLIEILARQDETIREQAELIKELTVLLSQYMTMEEIEKIEKQVRC